DQVPHVLQEVAPFQRYCPAILLSKSVVMRKSSRVQEERLAAANLELPCTRVHTPAQATKESPGRESREQGDRCCGSRSRGGDPAGVLGRAPRPLARDA